MEDRKPGRGQGGERGMKQGRRNETGPQTVKNCPRPWCPSACCRPPVRHEREHHELIDIRDG
jgi:hypothetical protein